MIVCFCPQVQRALKAGSRAKQSLKWWTSHVFKLCKDWVAVTQCQAYPSAWQFGQSPTAGQVLVPPGCEWNEARSYLFLLPVWLSGGGLPKVFEVNRWFSVTNTSSGAGKLFVTSNTSFLSYKSVIFMDLFWACLHFAEVAYSSPLFFGI